MSLKIQETPQAPSYAAANIQVPANIATPQATMDGVKAQQGQLNAVNNLSGGRRRTQRRQRRQYKHKSFIRTYKGRKYVSSQEQQQQQEQKGGAGAVPEGQIPVPQVGSTCASGPQCAGAQNANFTALHNQAQSNSINDAYAQSGGRGRRGRKNVRFSHTKHHRKTKQRHDDQSLTSMIAYNIKKVMRKVFN